MKHNPFFIVAAIEKLSYTEREEAMCEACTGISKFVDAELSNAVIKNELVEGLRQYICHKAPKSTYNLCSNLAKGYLPLALNKIEQFIGEGKLCKKAHACWVILLAPNKKFNNLF